MQQFLKNIFFRNKFQYERLDHTILEQSKEEIIRLLQQKKHNIVIFWNWALGGKWDSLLEKTPLIHTNKLHTTHKVMLAAEITKLHKTTPTMIEKIADILSAYYAHDQVLVIRSSWQWDAQWVWIYHSEWIHNTPQSITQAIQKVIQSNHSPNAYAYRQKIWALTDDFWVIIEPCIGSVYQNHKNEFCLSPLFSGWARSSSSSIGMWINFWLWWWVNEEDYIYIEDFKPTKSLHNLEKKEIKWPYSFFKENYFITEISKEGESWYHELLMHAYNINQTSYSNEKIEFAYTWKLHNILENSTSKLYYFLKKHPWTYIERATQLWSLKSSTHEKTYITQIGMYNDEDEFFEELRWARKIIDLGTCIRSWWKSFTHIIVVWGEYAQDIWFLEDINQKYTDYLLCISQRSTLTQKLPYTCFSNAWSIIEFWIGMSHSWTPKWHFLWLMEATKLLFSTTKDTLYKFTSEINNFMLWEQKINDGMSVITIPENKLFVKQDQKTKQWGVFIQ